MTVGIKNQFLTVAAIPLAQPGGFYDILEDSISKIIAIVDEIKHDVKLSEEQRTVLTGHEGLGGDFGNALNVPFFQLIRTNYPYLEEPQKYADKLRPAFENFAFTIIENKSQAAKFNEDERFKDETVREGIRRSIKTTGVWVQTCQDNIRAVEIERRDFVSGKLNEIKSHLHACDIAFQRLDEFAELTKLVVEKEGNDLQPMKLGGEEWRELRKLSKAVDSDAYKSPFEKPQVMQHH